MFQKILVAIDTYAVAEGVLEEAISLAKMTDASLLLLHVLTPQDEGYPNPIFIRPDNMYPRLYEEVWQSYSNQWENFNQHELDWLKSLTEQAAERGVKADFTRIGGEAGHTICEVAKAWNADLIVIGRRGRSGLNELILGSISNYVLHHAPCSVFTIQHKTAATSDATSNHQVSSL